jgi:hypothetical protein
MGLIDVVARSAARHAHVLVVEVPGHWRARAAVERAVLSRGWSLASSPADADVLALCGEPGPRLAEAVEVIWHQMPGPRVWIDVQEYDAAAARLDEAHDALLDAEHHRHDARNRPTAADLLSDDGGHGGMDHGGMDMSPGGIPLAAGGGDRDGLEMDVLNLRLGPVLPHWPAGLALRCSLQGDVITDAQAELVDDAGPCEDTGSARAARHMNNVTSLLALAGWHDAATEARAIRDALLERDPDSAAAARLARLHRRVGRSWSLRWSLSGLRPLSDEELQHHGLPGDAAGDTHDRLLQMLERAGGGVGHDQARAWSVDHVADLVTGLDLATARLVVASLDIHELRADQVDHEVSHA